MMATAKMEKRPRISNGNAVSGSPGAPCSVKPISPAKLKSILVPPNQESSKKYLLIDCVPSGQFNQTRIKSQHSVTFPISTTDQHAAEEPTMEVDGEDEEGYGIFGGTGNSETKFQSKASVVRFFLDHNPDFLTTLKAPGFYDNIVVVVYNDVCVRTTKMSWVIQAVRKWNEESTTIIDVILEAGVKEFGRKYPKLVISDAETSITTRISDECSTSSSSPSPNGDRCSMMFNDAQVKILDDTISTYRSMIKFAETLKTLQEVTTILIGEEMEKRRALIPAVAKCPNCQQALNGELFLCTNGHSICYTCFTRDASRKCRWSGSNGNQCGASMGETLRNLNLEGVLATLVKIDCVCREQVSFAVFSEHTEICVRNSMGEEYAKIEDAVNVTKNKIAQKNAQIFAFKKMMMEREETFMSNHIVAGCGMDLSGTVKCNSKFFTLISGKENTISTLKRELSIALAKC